MTLREEILKNCGIEESINLNNIKNEISKFAKDQINKLKRLFDSPEEKQAPVKVEPYATYSGSIMNYGLKDTSTDQVYKIFEIDSNNKTAKILKNNFTALCKATNRKCSPGIFETQAMYFRGKGYEPILSTGENKMY